MWYNLNQTVIINTFKCKANNKSVIGTGEFSINILAGVNYDYIDVGTIKT